MENFVLYVKVIVTIGCTAIVLGSAFALACTVRKRLRKVDPA